MLLSKLKVIANLLSGLYAFSASGERTTFIYFIVQDLKSII